MITTKPAPDDAPTPPRARVRRALETDCRADVVNIVGAARGLLVRDLLAPGPARARTVLAVAPDEDEAEALARDIAFFLGREAVVRIPSDAVLPYDDLSPDRGVEMERLSSLARLHLLAGARDEAALRPPLPGSLIRLPLRSPSRRCEQSSSRHARSPGAWSRGARSRRARISSARVSRSSARCSRRSSFRSASPAPRSSRTPARSRSAAASWIVEPGDPAPVRLELFGDEIESCRAFDPQTQRSEGDVAEVLLCPAREALFSEEGKEAAKAAVRDAAERAVPPDVAVVLP